MDIYYYLRNKLCCQDCKVDLKYSEDHSAFEWIAVCPACEKEYVIELNVKLHTPDVECECEKEICGICSKGYCDHNDCKCNEWGMR